MGLGGARAFPVLTNSRCRGCWWWGPHARNPAVCCPAAGAVPSCWRGGSTEWERLAENQTKSRIQTRKGVGDVGNVGQKAGVLKDPGEVSRPPCARERVTASQRARAWACRTKLVETPWFLAGSPGARYRRQRTQLSLRKSDFPFVRLQPGLVGIIPTSK